MSEFDEMLDVEPIAEVVCADCLEYMRTMSCNCVDAVITDPPYGLSFMGEAWDTFSGKAHSSDSADASRCFQNAMMPVFAEALRVSKPGAYLLCFGGSRTFHRMTCAIEGAGWEIRDCIMWVYGSGMPHGQNVAKMMGKKYPRKAGAWEGWYTQLKPAWEPIVVARKPLDGTVAKNSLVYGTGALNIDACRVPTEDELYIHANSVEACKNRNTYGVYASQKSHKKKGQELDRYPSNFIHDGSQEVVELFPDSKGQQGAIRGTEPSRTGAHGIYGLYGGARTQSKPRGDSGSAARFFYCAKASRKERGDNNNHPTVKPLALMEWLVRLVTREDALILDPFAGSGSTLLAAKSLNRDFVGIEKNPDYCRIAIDRLKACGQLSQESE